MNNATFFIFNVLIISCKQTTYDVCMISNVYAPGQKVAQQNSQLPCTQLMHIDTTTLVLPISLINIRYLNTLGCGVTLFWVVVSVAPIGRALCVHANVAFCGVFCLPFLSYKLLLDCCYQSSNEIRLCHGGKNKH
jgi:hypothetical protein